MSHADVLGGSGKLLLTGGVSEVEGAAGGDLTPWAAIGGYGMREQIGANAFYTNVNSGHYRLDSSGVLLGLYDRVELSYAQQRFDTRHVGALLGLGENYKLNQDIVGIKVKLAGDAVLEQGDWTPQVAVGVQYKHNKQGAVVRSVDARSDTGTDVYVSATKLLLAESVLLNGTLRATRANQIGILGFWRLTSATIIARSWKAPPPGCCAAIWPSASNIAASRITWVLPAKTTGMTCFSPGRPPSMFR